MRCSACDKAMTETEIQWHKEMKDWEVCSTCLEVAMDAAYSGNFAHEDEDTVLLDDETYRSYYDHCDIFTPETEVNYD